MLLASLLVPVIVGSGFFFPYVVPRNLFFRVVVELGITTLVLALCFGRNKLDLHDEPIFWSLVIFIASATLSAFFSPASTHSFFGDFERMGGVWAWTGGEPFGQREGDWTALRCRFCGGRL